MEEIKPICTGCNKTPDQIDEYIDAASDSGISPDDCVKQDEGTYNPENGHFLCTDCYILAGMPANHYSGPGSGWVAP